MKTLVIGSVLCAAAAAVVVVPRVVALIQRPAPAAAAAPAGQADDVSGRSNILLRRVELFADGVGFFQYGGLVEGSARTTLYFRSGQINDVLKSLVFQDSGGGQIGQAEFPSSQPLSVALSGFLVNLDGAPSMADILAQLRGHAITIVMSGKQQVTVRGRVMDVVRRHEYGASDKPNVPPRLAWYVNLYRAGGFTSVKLDQAASIQIDNPKLAAEVHQALGVLAGRTYAHKRPVTLAFKGAGRRAVQFAYLLDQSSTFSGTPLSAVTSC